jgi:hypothetical protein
MRRRGRRATGSLLDASGGIWVAIVSKTFVYSGAGYKLRCSKNEYFCESADSW